MSNSPLVVYTKLSPNHSGKRTKKIDTITIHCMAGNCSVETCGNLFANSARQASSNYGIGTDGRIALYVDEANRSWCTSSNANDQRAVTIEVANNGGAPDWPVSAKAYAALLDLVTDICKRNGIKRLVWSTSKNDRVNHLNGCNMTVHRDYANKSCPGDYLYNRHGQIAAEVNKRLGITDAGGSTGGQTSGNTETGLKVGDVVDFKGTQHYEHLNSDYTTETRYNPEGAQARYEANLRAKGPELKIGNDYELADYLIAKIRDEKYSPEAAIGEAEVKGWPFKTHICASTAYNYIRGEIFGDELTVSMLPQHGKRHQPERPAGSMPRKPAGRSIEDRPEHINDRSTFGHWEMDSVESCQGVSNTYIVMTERKTRWELIIPSPDKTAASVVAAIDGLEAKYGDLFPKVFRSITCDNGCEFADAAGIERSASGKGTRTEVYYCHPYRPSERGSNENQNGLIRRHLPKGTDLSTVSYEETKRIEDWLNNYPRKMFGYLCSEQLFREEIALILAS